MAYDSSIMGTQPDIWGALPPDPLPSFLPLMEEKKAKEDQGTLGANLLAGADLAVANPFGEGERLKKIKAPQVPMTLPR